MKQILKIKDNCSNYNSARGFIMLEVKEFLRNLFGTVKAVFRLMLVTITFFLSGLNNVIFAGREVCGFTFTYDFMSQDIDKLNYIDKLNMQLEDDTEEDLGDGYIYIEGDEDEEDY